MELTLNIDEHGRTTAPLTQTQVSPLKMPMLDYATNSFMFDNFNKHICDKLIQDCKVTTTSDLPLTFWLSAQDEPRCRLEKLAKDIFMHHVKSSVGLDPTTCGCEWWVQFRPSPNQKRINSQSQEAQRGIQFHWDKDETLRDVAGVFVHPHLSTVTYLTDNGAPTMVFEDSMPDEGLLDRGIKGAFISWPRRGKHLIFDGRFLHGAPSNLLETEKMATDVRVTFLVNIWLHHKPLGVEPFPQALLQHILTDNKTMKVKIPSTSCSKRTVRLPSGSPNIDDFCWGLGELLSIHAKLPINIIREGRRRKKNHDHGNISLEWTSNDLAFIRADVSDI
jgi:hypothetical protein